MPDRRRRWLQAGAVGWLVWCVYLVPIHQIPLGWDEGLTFNRVQTVRQWLESVGRWPLAQWPERFSKAALRAGWPFSREEPDGHGPFYALICLIGDVTVGRALSPPASLRVGSITLLAGVSALVWSWSRQRWGAIPASFALLLLVASPRLLPEWSFALIDGPLLCLALAMFVYFMRAWEQNSIGSALLCGLCAGCAMANKLTGWFFFAPYLAWAFLFMDRRAAWILAVAMATAGVVVLGLNVGWWPDFWAGIQTYFRSNLTRQETISIPTLFWGVRYPFALPWYNTIVWTVIAVPIGTLLFGLFGIGTTYRRGARPALRLDPVATLLVLNWGLLMVLRALPQAPGHDGTRQLNIAFGFLALLAGAGLARGRDWVRSKPSLFRAVLVGGCGLAAAGEAVVSCVVYHPHQLSYYSPLIGGLRGGAAAGFEPTYFWDSLTPDVLQWINQNTDPRRCVLFRNNCASFNYLTRWGRLTAAWEPGPMPQWVIYQNRPGLFEPWDRWLWDHGTIAYEKPPLFGVPLLRVFSGDEWRQARRGSGALRDNP